MASRNIADWGSEFSFFEGIHLRIDISTSISLMITKCGKQVYLQDLTQMRLIKTVVWIHDDDDDDRVQNHKIFAFH